MKFYDRRMETLQIQTKSTERLSKILREFNFAVPKVKHFATTKLREWRPCYNLHSAYSVKNREIAKFHNREIYSFNLVASGKFYDIIQLSNEFLNYFVSACLLSGKSWHIISFFPN